MGTYLIEIGIILAVLVVAVLVTLLVRKKWPLGEREPDNGPAGTILAVVGMIYAIIASFVFINGWQNLDQARTLTYQEADAVENVSWAAAILDTNTRSMLRELCTQYLQEVATVEWPRMESGKSPGSGGLTILNTMRNDVSTLGSTAISSNQVSVLDAIRALYQAREARIAISMPTIGGIMWFILVVGALVAALPAFFFEMEQTHPHVIMSVSVVAIICILICAIYDVNRPFLGLTGVKATAYTQAVAALPPD